MRCGGDGHRFCFKRCCAIRVFVLLVLVGGAFALGLCAGDHRGRGGFERQYHHYRGGMMMDGWGNARYGDGHGMMRPIYQYQIRTLPAQAASGTPVAPAPGASAK